MTALWHLFAGLSAISMLTACSTVPPGAERGPHDTVAYEVLIEASEPGARIIVEGKLVGNTPVRVTVYGDSDGTFHDFGSAYYMVHAFPLGTNQFPQTELFRTGQFFSGEDRIPERIFFDMNRPRLLAPAVPVTPAPDYFSPYEAPSMYYRYPGYYPPGERVPPYPYPYYDRHRHRDRNVPAFPHDPLHRHDHPPFRRR